MNNERTAAAGRVFGCVLFGLGSIIVAHVDVGAYAIAFWRLLVASGIFLLIAGFVPPLRQAMRRYFFY